MCILFIACKQHPEYPLIITANRDEYHARPSRAMHWWEDQPHVFAGRDLAAGGTWLGINTAGKFAAVTNLRSPGDHRPDARSRGELVVHCLQPGRRPEAIIHFLQSYQQEYNPFNLVFGDQSGLTAWGYGDHAPHVLNVGFHSISNGPLGTIWPKMSRGVMAMSRYIGMSSAIEPEALLPMMLDTTPTPDRELPQSGLAMEKERQLSAVYVQGKEYGTRTTAILRFSKQDIQVAEFQHTPETPLESSQHFRFLLCNESAGSHLTQSTNSATR